jgi:hypothetical protein
VVVTGARRQLEGTTVTALSHRVRAFAPQERGFSLIETMTGLCVLLVVAAGVLPLAVFTFKVSENQGGLSARASEYAQDKLEQLMALAYGDQVSDTRVFPAATTGGTGLVPGGSVNSNAPVNGYVDYLTRDGALIASADGTPPAGWYYQRLWRVEEVGAVDVLNCPVSASAAQICLKRITVTAVVQMPALGDGSVIPRATVTALKTYPF